MSKYIQQRPLLLGPTLPGQARPCGPQPRPAPKAVLSRGAALARPLRLLLLRRAVQTGAGLGQQGKAGHGSGPYQSHTTPRGLVLLRLGPPMIRSSWADV